MVSSDGRLRYVRIDASVSRSRCDHCSSPAEFESSANTFPYGPIAEAPPAVRQAAEHVLAQLGGENCVDALATPPGPDLCRVLDRVGDCRSRADDLLRAARTACRVFKQVRVIRPWSGGIDKLDVVLENGCLRGSLEAPLFTDNNGLCHAAVTVYRLH